MMMSRKRRRQDPPKNRYSETPPDFSLLASRYPSFQPFVFFSKRNGRPTVDWTDFNATRELTRVLLLHDHGVNWWIPDGQLCPTVPNRSNYIHWIEDLLSSEFIPPPIDSNGKIRGFDIGTGANCIYPLIGASLLGWSFVGSDFTEVALEWAKKNVDNNTHLSELIEIRNVTYAKQSIQETLDNTEPVLSQDQNGCCYDGPPILVGVVKDGEYFDFCMCNPPFFESMDAAGLNPKTACGGTSEEMVCHGGERAFILRIIEDSVELKHSFRWFTSMIGRKANLKFLISKLREVGVTIVKTTDFVQGQTCRWGLAWSFISPSKKVVASNTAKRKNHSFMLEGRPRQLGAFQVLKSVESFFQPKAASCKSDVTSFSVNVTISTEMANLLIEDDNDLTPNNLQPHDDLSFRISVFEQMPGTLLVKGTLSNQESSLSGLFSSLFLHLEETLKKEFLNGSRKTEEYKLGFHM